MGRSAWGGQKSTMLPRWERCPARRRRRLIAEPHAALEELEGVITRPGASRSMARRKAIGGTERGIRAQIDVAMRRPRPASSAPSAAAQARQGGEDARARVDGRRIPGAGRKDGVGRLVVADLAGVRLQARTWSAFWRATSGEPATQTIGPGHWPATRPPGRGGRRRGRRGQADG